MRQDEAVWAEIRRRYEVTSASLRDIGRDHKVSPDTISRRAKSEGWAPRPHGVCRPPTKARSASSRRPHKPSRRKPTAAPEIAETSASKASRDAPTTRVPGRRSQREAIARLFRAISLKLEHMEKRMANGEERSAQDEERETRALATMIRNFEKVTEAATELDRTRKPTAPSDLATTRADAERMRREIAERLERLEDERDTK